MKNSKWLMPPLALALTTGVASVAVSQATAPVVNTPATNTPVAAGQPAAGAAQDNDRQAERQRQREQLREQRRRELQNMTPEQRQQLARQNQVRILTAGLERAGVTDVAMQKSVTDYIASEETARAEARRTSRTSLQKLHQATRTGAVTEAQLGTLLDEYQNAVADEKARREASARALDARVGYSKNPRLKVLLITMGAVGDEMLYSGAGGLGGLGGPGGNGNGRGMGGNWPGNRGGQGGPGGAAANRVPAQR